MKTHLHSILAAGLLAMFTSGCDLLNLVDINFTTNEHSVDFTIEPASAGAYFEQVEIVATEIKKEIEDNGGSLKNLKTVKISDISVELVSGADYLDAFESFEIAIESKDIAEKKIAWIDDVPLGVKQATPEFTTDNLKDYVGQDTYTIKLKGVLRSDVTTDVVLKVKAHYKVTL
jgi:hypothetical protein